MKKQRSYRECNLISSITGFQRASDFPQNKKVYEAVSCCPATIIVPADPKNWAPAF